MKKYGLCLLIAVLCVTTTSWAGGRWNIETIQSQGNLFGTELSGLGSSYGTNSINVGQLQNNQAERLAVSQSSCLWGDGANSIALANGNYGQDLIADKDTALLGQGINLSTGTQLTTTPGWCWKGSAGSVTNSVNVGQTQNTAVANQSECVSISTTISGSGGGGGIASNTVNTVQNTWTEESRPHCCGWGQ